MKTGLVAQSVKRSPLADGWPTLCWQKEVRIRGQLLTEVISFGKEFAPNIDNDELAPITACGEVAPMVGCGECSLWLVRRAHDLDNHKYFIWDWLQVVEII